MMSLKRLSKIKNIDNTELDLSNVYEAHKGGFGKDKTYIPSYLCSCTVKELKDDLITFESLLSAKKWPVSKILQREVNRNRVNEISKKYIKGNDKIKYFPPIVVALIPRDNNNKMAESYIKMSKNDYLNSALIKIYNNSKFNNDEEYKQDIIESSIESEAEGLFVLKPFPINFQLFAWDKLKYYAVVIDGQHRFESLKIAASDTTTDYNLWKQDVMFIEGSSLNLLNPGVREYKPINFFRKIFIDINKNPIRVSKPRQIIMDDSDVASKFVQSIVDDDQEDSALFLHPELIDWHTNGSKHELPYVTSILNLHSIFNEKLMKSYDLNRMSDLVDESKVKHWINRLNDNLKVDSTIELEYKGVKKLAESYAEFQEIWKYDEFELFKFDYQIIEIAQLNFAKIYRESFVYYFNNLLPYKNLIKFLNDNEVFDRESQISDIVLKSPDNRTEFEKPIFKKLKREAEELLNTNYEILFTVVGQKAFVEIFYDSLTKNRGSNISNKKHLEISNTFIIEINQTISVLTENYVTLFGKYSENSHYLDFIKDKHKGLAKEYLGLLKNFWDDILFYDGNIKYNTIGVKAISDITKFALECNKQDSIENIENIPNMDLNRYKSRIKLKLVDSFEEETSKADEIASKFVEIKSEYIKSIFIKKLVI